MRLPLIVSMLGACATGGQPAGNDIDPTPDSAVNPPTPDSGVQPTPPDGPDPDTSQPPVSTSLLISEVALNPAGGEFVEIINPTATAVDLSNYYLSDSGTYFRLPEGVTVAQSDWIIRFTAGESIPAGGVITVALDTSGAFQTVYGIPPTYALGSATMIGIATNSTPTLTNDGELVVLFKWDGQSDLVADADIILAGRPTAANGLVDKSGIALDGPDADGSPSSYGADTRTIAIQTSTPGNGQSTKRIALETGFEATGANGLAGDDETSENTAMTWDSTFTAPTPGMVPAGLLP